MQAVITSFTLLNSTYTVNVSKFGYDANATTIIVNGGDLTNVNISLLYKLRTLSDILSINPVVFQ